jgi:hypothetical protein
MIRMNAPVAPAAIGPERRAAALRATLTKTWQGLCDGLRAARSYERLKAMSDAELARRGITRDQILRAAMLGEPDSGR